MRKHAFTLIEIIIAVSIFLIVALTLYSYSRETSNSWSRVVNERNRFNELLALDRALNGILEHLVPFTWPDNDGVKTPFLVAEKRRLRCVYLHHLNDEVEGALRFAEFVLEKNKLYLVYSDRPFLHWDEVGERRKTALLAEEVDNIDFLYADWSDDDNLDWGERLLWFDEWENVESERMDAPLAVKVTINWLDGRSETWLRRCMGTSYRERYGKWNPLPDDKR
jgi:prepilin-type N-terminal cleavage/methylation domain-containing protein